jgi:mannan endo-1,4-beta-mannosidase
MKTISMFAKPRNSFITFCSVFTLLATGMISGCKKDVSHNEPMALESAKDKLAPDKISGVFPNGVNIQPSYYNNGYPNFGWEFMKLQTKIKTVRLEIEPDKVNQAKFWISEARKHGYTVIATYHKSAVLGSDNVADLNAAANWWKTNYAYLATGGAFTVNLINEWGSHNLSANAYAAAYNTAIATVRTVYSGPLIIDIPGWGQETAIAAAAAKGYNGGTKIYDSKNNYILSAHIYRGAWNQAKGRYMNTSDLDDLASSGRPCILGEFGDEGGDTNRADWFAIVDYAKSKGWTVLGWAWNGDGGHMNMLNPSWVTNSYPSSFTKSWYFDVIYNKL